MLASKCIIAKRTICYCKYDFPPHRVDIIFLQQLSKSINHDAHANLELAKRNAHMFEHGDTNNKMHAFNATDLSRHYKIMQYDDKSILKSVQLCNVSSKSVSHHAEHTLSDDTHSHESAPLSSAILQSNWINRNNNNL